MKADKAANVVMYFAGLAFNLAIMALVAFLVLRAFDWGYVRGGEIADILVPFTCEDEYCDGITPPLCAICEARNRDIEFYIPYDMSIAQVAEILEEYGIIASRHYFMLDLYLRSITNDYRAGTFTLNQNMNNVEINRALRGGRVAGVAPHEDITIPEGWTIRDMAEYFEERGFFTAEEFIYVAQYGPFPHWFLRNIPADRPNRLEGYLFPDTYQIPVDPNPGDIIQRMLNNFNHRFEDGLLERADELGLTVDEVIIMASIIEAETRFSTAERCEFPIVSQVIHRRLAQNWLLQMCSTVKYIMEDPPVHLLYADLEYDSIPGYNTYIHRGLPIGPISNPGLRAIRAALWPADTNYMFFVLRNDETGEHFFSQTEAEHNAARARTRPW